MIPWDHPATVLALLAAFVAVAELSVRAWIRLVGPHYVWKPGARTHSTLDAESMPGLPRLVRFDVNRDGERGDPSPPHGSDTYRVIVLGASSTECRYLDQESTWTAAIQRFLNRPENLELLGRDRAHVGNLGRSLASCAHLDRILEGVAGNYEELDAIVLMAGGGDVIRWLNAGAPGVVQETRVDPDEVFEVHPGLRFGWRPRALALRHVIASIARRISPAPELQVGAGRGIGRARRQRTEARKILDTLPDTGEMLADFESTFRRLLWRARSMARTVVVLRPFWLYEGLEDVAPENDWMFAASDLRRGEVDTWFSRQVVHRMLAIMDRRVSAVAREMGIPEIDVKPQLLPGLAHFYDSIHPSPDGCDVVGTAVAQAVLREREGRRLSPLRVLAPERHADVA